MKPVSLFRGWSLDYHEWRQPDHKIFCDIERGFHLERVFRNLWGSLDESIKVERFIAILGRALYEKEEIPLRSFNFVDLSLLRVPKQQEVLIKKLIFKLLLGKENPKREIYNTVDEFFSKNFPNLCDVGLQEIINPRPGESKEIRHHIFQILCLIPVKDVSLETILNLKKIYNEISAPHHISNALHQIPRTEITDVIEKVRPLILNTLSETRAKLINLMANIPKSERSSFVHDSLTVLYKIEDLYWSDIPDKIYSMGKQKCALLQGLAEFPYSERKEVVQKSISTLDSTPSAFIRLAILKTVYLLPRDKRQKDIIQCIPSLYWNITVEETFFLSLFITYIPQEFRARAIQLASSQLRSVKKNGFVRASLLFFCWHENTFDTGKIKFNEANDCFFYILKRILPNEIKSSILASIGRLMENKFHDNIQRTLTILSNLPKELRTNSIVKCLAGLLIYPGDPSFSSSYRVTQVALAIECIALLTYLSPEKWEEAIPKLLRVEGLSGAELIGHVFSDTSIRESSHKFIRQQLESTMPPEQKWIFAKGFIDDLLRFYVHQEHDLAQLAISVLCLCDPFAMVNPKNPYRVHSETVKDLASEKFLPVNIATEEIAGEFVNWNVDKLREKGLWQGYTTKDLPQGIGPDTLKNLFQELGKRVNGRQEIEKYILDSFGTSFADLRANFLDKPFISNLLNPMEFVSATQFHLFAILQAILDMDDTVHPGDKISARHELLLQVSVSVQYCATGQRDGLANYYNALPAKYKRGPNAVEGALEKAEGFIIQSLQKVLNGVFTNGNLLNDIIGEPYVSHLSHITEYLKNRYHKQVGLQHQVFFDQHTGILPDTLLQANLETVVAAIFRYFLPSMVVRQIVLDSQEAIKDGLFVGIENLIKRIEGEIDGEEAHRRYWKFTEDLEPQQLTEAGALTLLKAIGLVDEHSKQEYFSG